MERTIEFVPHTDFDRKDVLAVMNALRPVSLEMAPVRTRTGPGVAFVTGLVEAPLLTKEEERYWFTWMNFLKFRAERNRRKLNLNHPDQELVRQIESDHRDAITRSGCAMPIMNRAYHTC